MPSKRCAMSAKRSGNCSSAPVMNWMACQSRCEIPVQASHRRLLSGCSKLSTPRNRAVWGLGCRSAGRLSKRITDDCGRARTCPAAPSFNSPCQRPETLRRRAALVSRPKEQATRPRVSAASKAVERLHLPEGKTDAIFFDDSLHGFGYRLRLTTSGKISRTWICQYRIRRAVSSHAVGPGGGARSR